MIEVKVGYDQVAEIMGIRNPSDFKEEIFCYDVEFYMNKASYYSKKRYSGVEDKLADDVYSELYEVFGSDYNDLTTEVFDIWIEKDLEDYRRTKEGNFSEAVDWFQDFCDFDNLIAGEISLSDFMDNNEIDLFELYECLYFAYEIDTCREFILDIAEKMFELDSNRPVKTEEVDWVYGWRDEEYGLYTRWEEKDGEKHGQYESVSEDGHTLGQYEYGKKIGTWNTYLFSMMYCSTNTNYLQECNIYNEGELVKHTEYEYEMMLTEMSLPELRKVTTTVYKDGEKIEVTRKERGYTKYHMYYNSNGDKVEDFEDGKLVNGFGSFTRDWDNTKVTIEKTLDGKKTTTITPKGTGVFGKKYEEKSIQETYPEGHSNTTWRDGILYKFSNYHKDGDEYKLITEEQYYPNGQVEMKNYGNDYTIFYNEDGSLDEMHFKNIYNNHKGCIKLCDKAEAEVIFERIRGDLEELMGIEYRKCS